MFCRASLQSCNANVCVCAHAVLMRRADGAASSRKTLLTDSAAGSALADRMGRRPYDVVSYPPQEAIPAPAGETWIAPHGAQPQAVAPGHDTYVDPAWGASRSSCRCPSDAWYWQVLPDGLIYHSYWAGVHEPRLGNRYAAHHGHDNSYLDGTLGGRVGLLRYGTPACLLPAGLAARCRSRRDGAAHARRNPRLRNGRLSRRHPAHLRHRQLAIQVRRLSSELAPGRRVRDRQPGQPRRSHQLRAR